MKEDTRFFEIIADKAQESRSKRKAKEAEVLRRIRRAKLAAGVALPPTDLTKFARHLGVIEVRHVDLAMRGRLVLEGNGIAVEINAELPEFDKRHTTAHELAHLILEDKRLATCSAIGRSTKDPASGPYSLIERLCNLGADEILLPGPWLRDRLRFAVPALEMAVNVSEEVDCTVDFVVARAISLGLWHCQLLWCEMKADKIFVTNAFREIDEASLATIGPLDSKSSVAGRCLATRRYVEGYFRLRINDVDHLYRAQAIPLSKDLALLMVVYSC